MEKKTFDERAKRLKEVDSVIKSLDPAIRADAFKILQAYVTGKGVKEQSGANGDSGGAAPDGTDRESFFTRFDHDKPADNVLLIAAFHYSEFGTAPVTIEEVRDIADDVGITVPSRVDMTLLQAKRNGKSLFARSGRSRFKPTVHGEKFFKETYTVSKGTKQKPAEGE